MGERGLNVARAALNTESLPKDPLARAEVLQLRALPDEDCPRFPPELETRIAATEERRAQCYLEMEEVTYRLSQLRKQLMNGTVPNHRPMLRPASEGG